MLENGRLRRGDEADLAHLSRGRLRVLVLVGVTQRVSRLLLS